MQQTGSSAVQRSTNDRESNAKEAMSTPALSMSPQSPTYTLPGVLHFLQQEWRRFERERNEWEIEKAEYKARIAMLEGERRGFANLKLDLMKRVKMLEYALRQERKKYMMNPKTRSLQQQEELNRTVDSPNPPSSPTLSSLKDANEQGLKPDNPEKPNQQYSIDDKAKTRSRELLKSCLQEINYLASSTSKLPYTAAFSSTAELPYSKSFSQPNLFSQHMRDDSRFISKRHSQKDNETASAQAISQQTQSTTQLQESIKPADSPSVSDDDLRVKEENEIDAPSAIPDVEVPANVDEVAMFNNVINIAKERKQHAQDGEASGKSKYLSEDEQLAKDVKEKYSLSEDKFRKLMKNAERMIHPLLAADEKPGSHSDLNLEELENLKLPNDAANETGESETEQKPRMWRHAILTNIMFSHLDSVRSVSLHADVMLIASASDDGTVKLWDLNQSLGKDARGQKKNPHEDTDPLITYRGHTLGVTKVEVSAEQGRLYSSSLDSTIRIWKLPPSDRTPYAPVDSSLNITTYIGHTDAIWDFKLFPPSITDSTLLASASADGTVKIWDTGSSSNLLKSTWAYNGVVEEYANEQRTLPVPTSLDFCHSNLQQLAVAYRSADIKIFDVETGQVVLILEADSSAGK
ncbi:hypothetical protein INT43_001050 [Umbelopsis isabellina]|uniref:Striatin N-terminal domain-containing protein n=1 Tax=Mortierella isabellina TaxID=91625 RepID=A0A8H7UD05_MORIS|nr:hypothetical protein INT43_001050 [Umbelopsis isabellina]